MSIPARKNVDADISRNYRVYLEIGLIVALLFFITVFKLDLRNEQTFVIKATNQDVIQMDDVDITKQFEKPVPPQRPPVPVEVPNDHIEDESIYESIKGEDLGSALNFLPTRPPEDDIEEPEIFIIVEQQPELVGGMALLQKSITYPEIARKAGIEGRVFLEFVVDERGRVLNPKVVRGIGGGCDEAALAAILKAKFKPGLQRGRPVKVKFALPIVFKLQS